MTTNPAIFLMLALNALLVGCFDDPTDRFRAQESLGVLVLDETRTVVLIEPGRQPVAESESRLRFVASAPTPTLIFGHAGPDVFSTTAIIENVFPSAELQPTLASLADVEGCREEGEGRAIVLAPFETERVGPDAISVDIAVPSCALLVLRTVVPDGRGETDGSPLHFAVVGETKGDLGVLEDITERIAALRASGEWEAAFLLALGNLANSPEEVDLNSWRDVAQGAGVPLVVALGEDEVADVDPLPFHRLFGRSDYSFAIGDVRFFVIDTASRGLSDAQLDFWRRELSAAKEPVRLAFMQRPPFDPSGIRNNGFTSTIEAASFTALLGENGVGAIFTGGVGTFERYQMGRIPVYATGGGGGPIEAFSDIDNHFLRVTVETDGSVTVETESVP